MKDLGTKCFRRRVLRYDRQVCFTKLDVGAFAALAARAAIGKWLAMINNLNARRTMTYSQSEFPALAKQTFRKTFKHKLIYGYAIDDI